MSDGTFQEVCDVTVNVDLSLLAPTFANLSSLTVREAVSVGTEVGLISATTIDPLALITYTLLPPSHPVFTLVACSGALRVIAPLDFETVPRYNITVGVVQGQEGTPCYGCWCVRVCVWGGVVGRLAHLAWPLRCHPACAKRSPLYGSLLVCR